MKTLAWEPLRRGRLAVLASPDSKLALREAVTLSELSDQRFLVNPRSLAPAAFEGLKLMCREFGGFDADVLESAVASTIALDTGWRPIRDGAAIAIMAEATARAVRPAELAVVPSSRHRNTSSPWPGAAASKRLQSTGSSATFGPTALSTRGSPILSSRRPTKIVQALSSTAAETRVPVTERTTTGESHRRTTFAARP
jgi:hypothetical protein